MRVPKFWIDGIVYKIGKDAHNAKCFKTESNDGKISTKFRLPTAYYDKIYNDPKFSLSNMKKTSTTEVLLPAQGTAGYVTITGDNIDEIIDAREEFHSLIQTIRETISPKQFIAIPTLSQEIKDNFNKFKVELLSKKRPISNLEEGIFQKAEKLHITVCVFALLDQVEVDEAIRLLNELKETIILPFFNSKEVQIRLKGISCMSPNLKKTNILYANASLVNETEDLNLQIVSNNIWEFFYEKGFMKELRDSVKIHVTLINTKYRKAPNSPKKRWNNRIPFDATSIVEEYKDFEFGICNLDSIHLSLMSTGTSTTPEDGFYVPLSIAKLT